MKSQFSMLAKFKSFIHEGARPRAGKPKAKKWASTLSKEQARETLRTEVIKQLEPLVQAQIDMQ